MDHLLSQALQTIVVGDTTHTPECIILIGLPGSGKSYVSHYLHKKYGYTVLSGENITHALFGTTQCTQKEYSQAYKVLHTLARDLLEKQYSVIIDGTNLQYIHRKQIYDALPKETKVFGIHLLVDDTTAHERISDRGEIYDIPTAIKSPCSIETFESFKASEDGYRDHEKIFRIISDNTVLTKIDEVIKMRDS